LTASAPSVSTSRAIIGALALEAVSIVSWPTQGRDDVPWRTLPKRSARALRLLKRAGRAHAAGLTASSS
jgi:hypothetical protein